MLNENGTCSNLKMAESQAIMVFFSCDQAVLWINGPIQLCWSRYQADTANQWVCGTGSWWVTLTLRYCQLVHSTLLNDSILITIHLCFSLRCPFMHGLFVSWGTTGWWFIINSRANIHVTIDCSTVLILVLGVVTRQQLQISGSVVLGADESPWPCGTPSWYTPLSWMILSKQTNLHLFSSQYICVFL